LINLNFLVLLSIESVKYIDVGIFKCSKNLLNILNVVYNNDNNNKSIIYNRACGHSVGY